MTYLNQGLLGSNGFVQYLLARKRKRNKHLKIMGFTLMLTSMVDMFSMLVVFLLQTFSSSPEILVNQSVELPDAKTASMIQEAPVMAVTNKNEVFLDQKLIGQFDQIIKNPKKLMSELQLIKQKWAQSHSNPFPGVVNLQAHKELKSTDVATIMGILTTSDYQSIQLSVIGSGM